MNEVNTALQKLLNGNGKRDDTDDDTDGQHDPYVSAMLRTRQKNYNVGLKTLLQQDISEPEFYGDLVYRFRKKIRNSEQFRKLTNRYRRSGYSLDIMQLTTCLVINR